MLLISSLCFAESINVCIYPANKTVSDYLLNTVKTVPYSEELAGKIGEQRQRTDKLKLEDNLHKAYLSENESSIEKSRKALEEYKYEGSEEDFEIVIRSYLGNMDEKYLQDKEFLSYICRTTESDVLIINETVNLDSLSMRTIRIYSALNNDITEISTKLSSESDLFTAEELKAISIFFNAETEEKESTEIKTVEKPLTVRSNVPSSVKLAGIYEGETPFTFTSYTLPMVLNVSAEGYSDRYVYITEETEEINAVLKPQWMEDREIYSKVKERFYYSFAGALLSVGVQALVNSLIPSNSSIKPYAQSISGALSVISIGNFIYNVIDYYNFADYNSKR